MWPRNNGEVFTDSECRFLESVCSGRLVTLGRDGRLADPSLPLRGFDELTGRGVEIHGVATLAERSGLDVICIRPVRVDRWNLEDANGHQSRFVT